MNKRLLTKEQAVYEGKRLFGAMAGAFLYAAGINLFVVPSGLYSGGVMGFCQVLRTILTEYFHLPFQNFDIAGIIYYLVNIPIFLIAFTKIGKKFFSKTVICVTLTTVFLSIIPTTGIFQGDTLAASIIGGFMSGFGIGVMLKMGASGGGLDVIGVILIKWKKNFSVGQVNLAVNVLLYGLCLFLFDVRIVVYSLIYAAVAAVATDKAHSQIINVEVHIITKKCTHEMEEEIFEQLGRGITKWQSLGAYTEESSEVLFVLMSKYEVSHLKTIVQKYDPNAFIVVNEGVNVYGNYLKKL